MIASSGIGRRAGGAAPGLHALGRAAAELVELIGARRTRRATRVAHVALALIALVVWTLPLF